MPSKLCCRPVTVPPRLGSCLADLDVVAGRHISTTAVYGLALSVSAREPTAAPTVAMEALQDQSVHRVPGGEWNTLNLLHGCPQSSSVVRLEDQSVRLRR